jgi:F-type H+-transporting ATPase subunit epsilon
VLAERALPLEELSPEIIDREILQAELVADTATDPAARQAAEAAITQLREARGVLNY